MHAGALPLAKTHTHTHNNNIQVSTCAEVVSVTYSVLQVYKWLRMLHVFIASKKFQNENRLPTS